MEALRISSLSSFQFTMIPTTLPRAQLERPIFNFPLLERPSSYNSSIHQKFRKFKFRTAISSTVSTELNNPPEEQIETLDHNEKFDWFSQWYPIMPVCDLDKRVPHAKKVMGLDVVVWWDRNESAWKVFDDSCPHRLAPLSEGRIDQWGRLQCVYHGWCFNGSGDCKFIPQAPPDAPQFHTFKKACVAVYPSTVQNDIVWFWPNTDPQYKSILEKKKPPYIPELDDPSYTKTMGNRDIPYGYEVLTENLMDPAHVPYAHKGLMQVRQPKIKADREGGRPLEFGVQNPNINGFIANLEMGKGRFSAPCVFFLSTASTGTKKELPRMPERISMLIFICIPVSPGNSRLIWVFPRNFAVWIDRIVPRWLFHVRQNLILDSDLYLLHLEERKIMDIGPSNWQKTCFTPTKSDALVERKIMDIGPSNWQKTCFTPTKSDALVVGFRKWLNKYAGGHIDWGTKFSGALPPTPPREQLLDRYWSHTVNCRSCSAAYKYLNALEVVLQVVSVASIGVAAAAKEGMISAFRRNTLVFIAVLCFAASRWLSHFIYKNFRYHDYNHALL